jgi:hypothetical protein
MTQISVPTGSTVSSMTGNPSYAAMAAPAANKPLRRPTRLTPLRALTHAELKGLAINHAPPTEWLNEDEECPFIEEQ